MYLTILKEKHAPIPTLDDILSNPYMTLADIRKNDIIKKITLDVPETYGKRLYKRYEKDIKKNICEQVLLSASEIIPVKDIPQHYKHYQIPKKSNPSKKRDIDAPDDQLKYIQECILNYMKDGLHIKTHKSASAYELGESIATAMEKHQKNESHWYLQIDLKDFFPSITEEILRQQLLKVYPFPFIDKRVFNTIVNYALLNGKTPQGSKISPILSNLIMIEFDYKLTEKLHNYKKHHYVYTRYADDITISCKEKFNKNEILDVIKETFEECNLNLSINDKKTRFGSRAGRNYHLGLIINKDNQISVGHEKNAKFRAMLFNFCSAGEFWSLHSIQKMLGIISYYKSIEPEYVERQINKYNNKFNMNIMETAKDYLNKH